MGQAIPKAITLDEFLAQPETKLVREFIASAIWILDFSLITK